MSEPKTLFVVDALTLGNDLTQIEIITTTIERTEVFLRKNEHANLLGVSPEVCPNVIAPGFWWLFYRLK